MAQYTRKYIPKVNKRESNIFLEEYYSGTDTKVYINDEEQTEISYIQYSVNEQLKPLYGYASRTWDDVAVGNRIVTGVLKMPIRNPKENDSNEVIQAGEEIGTIYSFENKNEQSALATAKKEWINHDKYGHYPQNTGYNSEVQKYQVMLQQLGYQISIPDGQATNAEYIAALVKFAETYNCPPLLNEVTKVAIQQAIINYNYKREVTTEVDLSPSPTGYNNQTQFNHGVTTRVKAGDEVYLVQGDIISNGANFSLVRTKGGICGYILTSLLKTIQGQVPII